MSAVGSSLIQPKVLGGLAAASVAGLAAPVSAAVQYTPANIPINATDTVSAINLTGPSSGELSISYSASNGITLNKNSAAKANYASDPTTFVPLPMSAGESVSSAYGTSNEKLKTTKSGTLISANGPVTGEFTAAAGEKFIGVNFEPVSAGPSYYGWIGFKTLDDSSSANLSGVITGWAYEDSGGDILAGDTGASVVPEPSSLALLAAGAAGLGMYRKRRR
jgi:hypothetical protein